MGIKISKKKKKNMTLLTLLFITQFYYDLVFLIDNKNGII